MTNEITIADALNLNNAKMLKSVLQKKTNIADYPIQHLTTLEKNIFNVAIMYSNIKELEDDILRLCPQYKNETHLKYGCDFADFLGRGDIKEFLKEELKKVKDNQNNQQTPRAPSIRPTAFYGSVAERLIARLNENPLDNTEDFFHGR